MRNSSSLLKATCSAVIVMSSLAMSNPAVAAGITASSLGSTINVSGTDYNVTFNQVDGGTTYSDIFTGFLPTFSSISDATEAANSVATVLNSLLDPASIAFPASSGIGFNTAVPFGQTSSTYSTKLINISSLSGPAAVATVQPNSLTTSTNSAIEATSFVTFSALPSSVSAGPSSPRVNASLYLREKPA